MTPSTTSPTIVSIQIGQAREFAEQQAGKKSWTSAIIKETVKGPVTLSTNGLSGDQQVDREHHGGPDKAVLAYAVTHYAAWREQFPAAGFAPGGFGENLSLEGIDETQCCIGDIFSVGDCTLEISQPRRPCWKLSRRWNIAELTQLVQKTGRTGWYLRVLQPGQLEAGMSLTLVDRPCPEMTISRANAIMYARPRSAHDDNTLVSCPALSASWRKTLRTRTAS